MIYRVCSEKEKIGSWCDVAEILNNLTNNNYNESTYRKRYQYFMDMLEANQKKFADCDAKIEELNRVKDSLQRERYKLQATKLEITRDTRQDSRFELFYENVREAIKVLPLPQFTARPLEKKKTKYVVGFGDIHYGANFTSENNVYSRAECKRRFDVLLSYLKDFVQENGISNLTLLNVGDDIQGLLRLSDLQINDIDAVKCVVEISQIIAGFLNALSEFCDIDYYHVSASNHTQTRNLGSKASVLAGEDLEKVIANYIHDVLINNTHVTINFDMSKEYIDFKVFNFDCTAEHGHRISNLKTFLKDKCNLRRKFYSYAFIGHTHSSKEIIVGEENKNNLEVLVVPSFVGSDPYSDTLNVGSKAMAKIYEFDELYGHIGSKNIILN